MSPWLKRSRSRRSTSPADATTTTPASVTPTPTHCSVRVGVPYASNAPASTNTGIMPWMMPMLIAVVWWAAM